MWLGCRCFVMGVLVQPHGLSLDPGGLQCPAPRGSCVMTRRFWLWCLAWSLGWLGLGRQINADQQQATLNEMLRSVLRCRRPQEFAYVDLVTQKVEQGELPRSPVLS